MCSIVMAGQVKTKTIIENHEPGALSVITLLNCFLTVQMNSIDSRGIASNVVSIAFCCSQHAPVDINCCK